jgi:nucleotide-binding universal stress UspA family protein
VEHAAAKLWNGRITMTETRTRPRALNALPTDRHEEHLVLATDGGLAGLSAMRWVADRARLHVIDLEVVDVLDSVVDPSRDQPDDPRLVKAHEVTRQARDYLGVLAPSVEVRTRVLVGDPRSVLARTASEADLLVVGTNRTGRSPHFTASFSTKVAEVASCPTMVVPRGWERSSGAVVVGVEGDGSEDAALDFAAHEAEVLHRDLVLVHAWRLASIVAPAFAADLDRRALEQAAGVRLTTVSNRMRDRHPGLRIAPLLEREDPASAVLRAGRGAALVVVGTHGLGVIDRMLFASVSRAVLERPTCPVAVVPPTGWQED